VGVRLDAGEAGGAEVAAVEEGFGDLGLIQSAECGKHGEGARRDDDASGGAAAGVGEEGSGELKALRLAIAVWVSTKMQVRQGALVLTMWRTALEFSGEFNAQGIRWTVWAFAMMKIRPEALMQALGMRAWRSTRRSRRCGWPTRCGHLGSRVHAALRRRRRGRSRRRRVAFFSGVAK